MTCERFLVNPHRGEGVVGNPPTRAPLEFHRRLPGYAPGPLRCLPNLARLVGVREVWLKDESTRFGLPSFKILGASWATYRALQARLGQPLEPWDSFDELTAKLRPLRPITLVTATDGNHGRAVARMAALLGLGSRIYLPEGAAQARVAAIAEEGADVIVTGGSYDYAVALSADDVAGDAGALLVSDTAWPGYEQVPNWVVEGYSTILWETDDAFARAGASVPDVISVQIGVGALASAVVRHEWRGKHEPLRIVGVEPADAACALVSIEKGEPATVPGPHRSVMAGLNCGTPSSIAWPLLKRGIDAFVAIDDEWAQEAVRRLAESGVRAGESGAAGLAGLLKLRADEDAAAVVEAVSLTEESSVLVIVTEAVTDPVSYDAALRH